MGAGLLSSRTKPRPSIGFTPSTRKKSDETVCDFQLLRRSTAGQGVIVTAVGGDGLEGMIARAPIEEVGIAEAAGKAGLAHDVIEPHHPHQPVGSGNGSGRSSTLLIRLKMAVVAPMPRASVRRWSGQNLGSCATGESRSEGLATAYASTSPRRKFADAVNYTSQAISGSA